MPKAPTTSQRKGFRKGDLVYLPSISCTSQRDNVYRVEGIEHRSMMSSYPDSSLLKLRLVFKVFYSWERMDGFQHYDELNCELLEASHIAELQARFGKIILDIAELYEARKKEQLNASADSPRKRPSRRKALEPEGDKRPKARSRSKQAL
jgi:hypothetical protein